MADRLKTERVKDKIAKFNRGDGSYSSYDPRVKDLTEIVSIENTMPIPKSPAEARATAIQMVDNLKRSQNKEDFIRAGIAHNDRFAVSNPNFTPVRPGNPYQRYLYPLTRKEEEDEAREEAMISYDAASSGNRHAGRRYKKTRRSKRASKKSRKSKRRA